MKTVWNWHSNFETANEANSSENRFVKSERHKMQKKKIKAILLKERPPITIPCNVVLTRIAPRCLDEHDNLRMCFKWIADAIAEYLVPGKAVGRADDCKEIGWAYKQEKGGIREYAIRIEISGEYKIQK